MNPISMVLGLKAILSGNKTYIIAGLVVIVGVLEGALGVDLPGVVVDPENWVTWIFGGGGFATMRAALAKVGVK